MKFFILFFLIPSFALPITPTLSSFDEEKIVLSFPCVQGSLVYNVYRLPFISKRRDAKPRLYDKLYLTQPQDICIYEDWYPFDLTERNDDYIEYIITYISPDGISESSFAEGYFNRLRLQKAKANFTYEAESFCPQSAISFHSTSTGLITNLIWYKDLEEISNGEEISYIFDSSGEYDIKLEAIGPIGKNSITKKVKIFEPEKPKVEGENYACESTILYTKGGRTDYKWYYNGQEIEGANSSSLNVSNPGTYKVSYKDENKCFGISDPFEFSHFPEPEALFEISSSEIPAGQFIYFTNKSIGEDLNYLWEFGDGNSSFLENPNYVYRKPGNYIAKLLVKDKCGKEAIFQKEINVLPGLFDISKDNGTEEGGTLVKITGNNFPENPKVYIDNKLCEVLSSNSQEIEILTPKHKGGLEYYDIEIKDLDGNLIYKMNHMFRFVKFGFITFSEKVSTIDMDKLEFYGWDIEIQNPKAIHLEGKFTYIGGIEKIIKFNSGTGEVEASLNLEAGDQVFSIITEEGLYGKYLFASIYNPAKNPKGKVLILDENLNLIAFSDFKGSQDGVGLEFEKAKGKVYLLAQGPMSESDNQEHKKKMILNIYNPMAEFEEEDGIFYLPILKVLSKDKDSQNQYFTGAITKTEDEERLYYGDPSSQNIIEIKTEDNSFKGPDIETANNPISLSSFSTQNQNFLLSLSKENSILEVYTLPENGKKLLQNTISISSYGCTEPKFITINEGEGIITCSNNKLIFIDLSNFASLKEFTLNQSPEKIKIQKGEEE